jgi:death-on-curing protein
VNEPRWLRQDVILAVHQKTLREQGGLPGIRDLDMLESALARPINTYQYADKPNVYELAAAYGFGIAKNHPFMDGNKRVGFYASVGFLRLNGFILQTMEVDAAMTFLDLAAGSISEEKLALWFLKNTIEA